MHCRRRAANAKQSCAWARYKGKDAWGLPSIQVEHAYSSADVRRRTYLLRRARRVLRKAGGLASYTYPIDSFSHAVGFIYRCAAQTAQKKAS